MKTLNLIALILSTLVLGMTIQSCLDGVESTESNKRLAESLIYTIHANAVMADACERLQLAKDIREAVSRPEPDAGETASNSF